MPLLVVSGSGVSFNDKEGMGDVVLLLVGVVWYCSAVASGCGVVL